MYPDISQSAGEYAEPEEAGSSVQSNAKKGTVTLQFQKLGPNIGHYNAVLVDSEHSNPSSRMATSSVQLAQSTFTVKAKDILPLPKNLRLSLSERGDVNRLS